MSEISKSRQGRVRRNVTALVSAVALACGTVAVPQVAGAYVYDSSIPPQFPSDGDRAEVKTTVRVEDLAGDGIRPGDDVVYRVSAEAIAPKAWQEGVAGSSDIHADSKGDVSGAFSTFQVELEPDANAPIIDEQPIIRWEGLADSQTTPRFLGVQRIDSKYVLRFQSRNVTGYIGSSPKVSISFNAKVNEDLQPGTTLCPKSSALAFIQPVSISNSTSSITDIGDRCTFEATHLSRYDGGGYGSWLREVKIGTYMENNVTIGQPRIEFFSVDPRRQDAPNYRLTGFEGFEYWADDPDAPDTELWQPEPGEPEIYWKNSFNWRYNPNARTGSQWIEDGTWIKVTQVVRNSACASGDQNYNSERGRTVEPKIQVDTIVLPRPTDVGYFAQGGDCSPILPPDSPTTSSPVTTVTTTATVTPTTVTTTATETPTTVTTTATVTPSTATTIPTVTPSTASVTETTTVATATTTVATQNATATVTPTTVTTTPTVTAGTVTTTATTTVPGDCDCEPSTATVTKTIPAEPSTVTETPEPATVTKTEPAPRRGEIGDRVWVDENGDGKEDPGEKTGVPGVTVEIVDKASNEVTRTVTDKDGNWKVDVEPGDYTVRYVPGNNTPSDQRQVERTITIKPGEKNFNVDLGILPKSSIGDRVWNDEDGDGKQGPNEKGLENVVVLVSRDGEPTRSAVTDKNGDWKIEGLNPNKEYEVRFIKPEGWEVTGKVPDSDESGLISKVTLEPKQYNDTYDLGLRKIDGTCDCELEKPGTIGDRVWIDVNGDGKEDSDEKTGVPGVTVVISDKDGNEVTRTVTDNDGNWKVDVVPGDYTVTYEPGDHTPSQPNQITSKITVEPGKKYLDIDLGILPRGTVGDRVWNDEDGDGVQDDNEKGLRDVVVQVSRNGEPTRTTTTDENGNWFIEGLKPNTEYQVRFIKPEGWDVTGKVPGSDESGLISKVTLKPGERNDAYDLGLRRTPTTPVAPPEQPGKFGGNIIVINPDGSKEGVENVIVRATPPSDVDEPVRTGTTNKDGAWTITNLTPNVEYEVTYILPKGYRVTYLPDGATLDKDGNVTITVKVNDKVPTILDFGLEVERGGSEDPEPSTVTNTVTETVVAKPDASSDGTLEKCWANATQSPLLYLVPVALLGAVGGELARPYAALINEQINKVNAELAAAFNRSTPDWGNGGRGADRNDPFAELRAQFDAANREFQKIANDPNVQRLGTAAAVILGLVALGGVLYDWCSNEPGEAKTASSKRTGGKPTTTVPTSPTEPTEPTTAETPTQQP